MDGSTNQSLGQRAGGNLRARGTTGGIWRYIVPTLRVKVLLAFLIVALFPLVVLALFNYRSTEQALTNSANQALFAAASQTAVRLDAFITAELSVIKTEAQLPILAEYLNLFPDQQEDSRVKAQVFDILQTFTQKDAVFISSYGLLDLEGRNVIDTNSSNVNGDESAQDYFREALRTGLAYVSPVKFTPDDGKAYLYFSSAIYTIAGQPVGVLRVRYSAAILQQLVVQDNGLVGPQSYPVLLDENGLFLADGLLSPSSSSSLLYTPAVPLDPDRTAELERIGRLPPGLVDTAFTQMPGLTEGLAQVDSPEPYFIVQRSAPEIGEQFAAITRMKTRPWSVTFLEPRETFLAPARAQARSAIILAAIIMILVAVAAIGTAQLLTNPITYLTVAVRQIAKGNHDTKVQVNSNDEIGLLAAAFNSMTSQLVATLEGLRTSEENYRGIVENAIEGIYRVSLTGKMLSANPAMAYILGFDSPDELVASVADVRQQSYVHPEDRDVFLSAILEQGTVNRMEFQFYCKDKQIIWLSINARLVRDETGRPLFIEGFCTNITERKHAEQEIRRLNEELEQRVLDRTAQLEAAIKEHEAFTHSVAHDLRAPLRHIDGFIELLQKKTKTTFDDQALHYMHVIAKSARKMGTLIDNLLSFSRIGREEMLKSQIDLGKLVRDVIQEFQTEIAGRDVRWEISTLPKVIGDEAMLRIVLVNLIANALKFTRPCQPAEIEIGYLPEKDNEIVIFIRDNGVGFDMAYADKLFGVFQRLHHDDEFEGTGIGLANVRRIIDRHGGRTWAEGAVSQGATFYFSLSR